MEELEGKVKEYLKEIDYLLNSIEEIKENRSKKRLELEQIKSDLQDEFIHQNTARLNIMTAREKMDETHTGVDSLETQAKEIEEQIASIIQDKKLTIAELATSEELEKNIEIQILEFQTTLEELRKSESAQTAIVSEKEVEAEKILQRIGFEQQNLDRI